MPKRIENNNQEQVPLLEKENDNLLEESSYIGDPEFPRCFFSAHSQLKKVTGCDKTEIIINSLDKEDVGVTFPWRRKIKWRLTLIVVSFIFILVCIMLVFVIIGNYKLSKHVHREEKISFRLVVCANNNKCQFIPITVPLSDTIQQVKKYVSDSFYVTIDNLNLGGILYKDGSYAVLYDLKSEETLEKYTSNAKIIRFIYLYIEEGESGTLSKITQPTTSTVSPMTSTSAPDIKNNAGFVIGIGLSVLVIVIAFVIYVCQKELNEEDQSQPCTKSENKETETTSTFFEIEGDTNDDAYTYSDGNPSSIPHIYNGKGEMYRDYRRHDINSYIRSCENSCDMMSPLINHPGSPYAEFLKDIDGFEILPQIYL